jgi:hypothetical protein
VEFLRYFVEEWGMVIGVGGLIAFMVFIMWDLVKTSKAGKFGGFIIFLALGLGLLGFIIKVAIQYGMETSVS